MKQGTFPSVTDHCGHDTRSQITGGIDSKSWRQVNQRDRKMIDGDMPVCIPNETAMPRMAINTTNGTRPADRGFFLLPSETANTTNTRTNVPMNWALLVWRLDTRRRETYFVKETVGRGQIVKLKKKCETDYAAIARDEPRRCQRVRRSRVCAYPSGPQRCR